MAEPVTVEVDTKMLDVFVEALESLLEAYDEARITSYSLAEGVRDLITINSKIPRSITVSFGDPE